MLGQRLVWIAWPAFLVACLLELVVFGLIDPQDIQLFEGMSRMLVYSLSFFVFWVCSILACGLTYMLLRPPSEVNHSHGT